LKLEGHALTWWKNHVETNKMEGDIAINRWEDFKTLINSQFYRIDYVEENGSVGTTSSKDRGRVYRSTPLSSKIWPS
jgi:hypothetical protein